MSDPRATIVSNDEVSAMQSPGSGNYNPHNNIKKERPNPTWNNPKSCQEKTIQESKRKLPIAPDMTTYNPFPVCFATF